MTTDRERRVSRRAVLRAGGAATTGTALVAASDAASAQEGGGSTKPDFGSWLSGSDGGYKDARGQSAVTVSVGASGNGGNFAFSPAGLWIDSGTKVTWQWTGQGGGHNVDSQSGASFSSGSPTATEGHTFEHTFSEGGISTYQCDPHASLGMKGAIAVGDGVPTVSSGGYVSILPDAAKVAGVVVTGAMAVVLGLAYFFLRYGGGEYEGGGRPPEAD